MYVKTKTEMSWMWMTDERKCTLETVDRVKGSSSIGS